MTIGILPRFLSPKQRFGAGVEEWAAGELAGRGYAARLVSEWTSGFDLVIDNTVVPLAVEVKGAQPTWCYNGSHRWAQRWQFDTARLQRIDHVVMLVVIDAQREYWPFIIPSWRLWDRPHVAITSHPQQYRGRWLGFLNSWDMINHVAGLRQRYQTRTDQAGQLPLWGVAC